MNELTGATANPALKPRPRPAHPPCENCKWYRTGARLISTFKEFGVVFDVAAVERVALESGRAPVTLSWRRLRHYVTAEHVNTRHLAHVDRSKPGVMGVIRFKGRRRFLLIEGTHRAFLSARERQPFKVYLLTLEETASCLE